MKHLTIEEVKRMIEESNKHPKHDIIVMDYASLYPSVQKSYGDEWIEEQERLEKVKFREERLDKLLDNEKSED